MNQDSSATTDHAPDASDVVDGPIGSAWLKDPGTSGPIGADLEALPVIEIDPTEQTDEGGSIDSRRD